MKEKLTQKNIWTAVAILVIIILLFFIFKHKAKAPEVAGEANTNATENITTEEEVKAPAPKPTKTTLYIPDIKTVAVVEGEAETCVEEIVFSTEDVAPTRMPLTATYNKLFTTERFTKSGLTYDRTDLQGDVAKVYLKGALNEDFDDCARKQMKAQLGEAALHFSNIKSVQIYLNDAILDWAL